LAGLPDLKHFVPSGNEGCFEGMHNVFAPMASPDALFFFTSSSTSSSSHLHEETSTCDNFAAWNPGEDQDHTILESLMMAANLKK